MGFPVNVTGNRDSFRSHHDKPTQSLAVRARRQDESLHNEWHASGFGCVCRAYRLHALHRTRLAGVMTERRRVTQKCVLGDVKVDADVNRSSVVLRRGKTMRGVVVLL